MNEVVAIVEGETEQDFVREVLGPDLLLRGIRIWARLPGRRRRHGGVDSWESIRGDIMRTLKESSGRYCTTMFDFNGMPHNWPGRVEAADLPWDKRGEYVEGALSEDLAKEMGGDFRRERFIPYVQVHEFEAVLFVDADKLAGVLAEICSAKSESLAEQLMTIVNKAGAPEAINDDPNSAPSKRILKLAPGYRKRSHGLIAAQRIQLATMRAACKHFDLWISRLEQLGL